MGGCYKEDSKKHALDKFLLKDDKMEKGNFNDNLASLTCSCAQNALDNGNAIFGLTKTEEEIKKEMAEYTKKVEAYQKKVKQQAAKAIAKQKKAKGKSQKSKSKKGKKSKKSKKASKH